MSVSNYSATASSNSTISGTNIAENCAAGNLNDAIRQMMADIRAELTNAVLTITGKATVPEILTALGGATSTTALTAVGALTPAADRLPYFTSASAAALATLTTFARTLLDDADAATARTTLGAISISAASLANPGYLKFSIPAVGTAILQWGTQSIAQDSSAAITYPTPFATFSIPIVGSVTRVGTAESQNTGMTSGSATTTGFMLYNAQDATLTVPWFAIGV